MSPRFGTASIGMLVLALNISAAAYGAEVFFGNLHSHTSISDGSSTPNRAYRHARDVAELDFLAITEHNHRFAPSKLQGQPHLYNGSQSSSLISRATKFTKDDKFVALYGQEFSSIGSGNHANVLDVDAVIKSSEVKNGAWDDLLNTWLVTNLDSQGKPAILLLNHPALSGSRNDEEYGIDDFASFDAWRTALDKHAQLINIINGPSHRGNSPGDPSESEFLRYLNLGLHVAPTADQDNHRRDWGSVVDTRSGVIADSLTKDDILDALRERHVYASQDRNLRIIATINGHLIGSRVSGADVPAINSELDIEVSLNDDDEPNAVYTIDVFADVIGGPQRADVVAQFTESADGSEIGNGDHDLPGVRYTGGQQYFFLRIKQTDPDESHEDMVWLAPVWFEPSGAAITSGSVAVTLAVNEELETATIANVGSSAIDLKDWKLVSTRGNQVFTFEATTPLAPGAEIVVSSGPSATDSPPSIIEWTKAHIWANSGDPGQLFDANNTLVAETN